jgi:hypothetical protein
MTTSGIVLDNVFLSGVKIIPSSGSSPPLPTYYFILDESNNVIVEEDGVTELVTE